jgi:hypothetical protein
MNVHIDDLPDLLGKDLGTGGWLTVSQHRIDTFADATDDHHMSTGQRARECAADGGVAVSATTGPPESAGRSWEACVGCRRALWRAPANARRVRCPG